MSFLPKRVSVKWTWWSLALLLAASPSQSALPLAVEEDEALSGGSTTVHDTSHNAFGRALGNMERTRWTQMLEGKALFMRDWPAFSKQLAGPLSNASGCGSCHFKDGRGRPLPEPGPEAPLLVRLSVPSTGVAAGSHEPVYGGQLNDQATSGVPAEGTVEVSYTQVKGRYADGTSYTLRKPHYRVTRLAYGPLAPRAMLSPRIPATVFGLGLLEAIPEEAILALADPEDRDGDGVSGRPNRVASKRLGKASLGRFGWKANQPSLEQQVASAFSEDLGLTSPLFPERNCTAKQESCRAIPVAQGPELSEHQLQKTTLYLRLLAVPARRDVTGVAVRQGQALFQQAGCATCHHSVFKTGEVSDVPELAQQTIRPYTDLLLHDMGPELADGRPDAEASGSEWRTAPLWGLGLLEAVNRQVRMLHDGRARSFEEAILWHGGEAAASRERFKKLEREEREALISFLRSL
ncbi:di-heme oxidoredictase family protein [Hyalangium sp.]|uniref:di-heme oxidoreductase family protein n=1 Tax=Hyalangium sp. TaxID=2028555 RepID=UPI002D31BFBE|nr:di-heme oxidoredictase family protein [Hyalangium sp.]HYI00402.1 di-heme oxidoredictase family protein [Hyalangium sp.]